MAGKCAAMAVQVNEFLGEDGNVPYCDTFATSEAKHLLDTAEHMGSLSMGPGMEQDWYYTEFSQSFDEQAGPNHVGCQVSSCVYFDNFHCMAEPLAIDAPLERGSTLSICETYRHN